MAIVWKKSLKSYNEGTFQPALSIPGVVVGRVVVIGGVVVVVGVVVVGEVRGSSIVTAA